MAINSHRDLVVWQKALDLVELVYRLTRRFPADERFGLVAQMRRAGISIPANVAEGHGRRYRREFQRFVSIARGSLMELQTLLEVSSRLGYAAGESREEVRALADEVGKMLSSLQRRLADQHGPDR